MPYMEKTIKAGDYMEIIRYPSRENKKHSETRERKTLPTRKVQEALNNKNTTKYLSWMMQSNFTTNDNFTTLTFANPKISMEEAKKAIKRFTRQARDFCRAKGRPEFKYIYTVEVTAPKTGIHFHMVCNALTFDEIDRLWHGRTMSSKLQFDENGLLGLARYMTKEFEAKERSKNEKRWAASRNLKKPDIQKPKIVKRINPMHPPERKGYKLVTYEANDNKYFGIYQHALYIRI